MTRPPKTLALAALFASATLAALLVAPTAAASEPWLPGFSHRTSLQVDNPGGNVTELQVLFILDTQALVAAGAMQPSCADLRITTGDAVTLIPHWLESGCNTSSTPVWVKIPTLIAGGSHPLYAYSGATGTVNSTSDARTVFIPNTIRAESGPCTSGVYCGYMDNHAEALVVRGYPSSICQKAVTFINHGSVCDNTSPPSQVREYFYARYRFLFIASASTVDGSGIARFGVDSDDGSEVVLNPQDSATASASTVVAAWYGGHGCNCWGSPAVTGSRAMAVGSAVWMDYLMEEWQGGEAAILYVYNPSVGYRIASTSNFPNTFYSRTYVDQPPTVTVGLLEAGPPTTSLSLSGTLGTNGYHTSAVTANFECLPPSGGACASTTYRIDGGAWINGTGPFNLTSEGNHLLEFASTSAVGFLEETQTRVVRIDLAPPTPAINAPCADEFNGWCRVTVNATGSATDTVGVATFSCALDGTPTTCTNLTILDGMQTFSVTATDIAGLSATVSQTYLVDTVNPTIALQSSCATPGAASWCRSAVDFAINPQDAEPGSGIENVTCQLNGIAHDCDLAIAPDGVHAVSATARDRAGREASTTITVHVDQTAPVADFAPTCAVPGLAGWCRGNHTAFLSANDDVSGVASTVCSRNGATVPCGEVRTTLQGAHTLRVAMTDVAGNEGTSTLNFAIDAVAPTLATPAPSCASPGAAGWCRSPSFTYTYSAQDATSGLGEPPTCTVDAVPAACSGSVSGEGSHTLTISATDTAGNVATRTVIHAIDTSAPPLLQAASGPGAGQTTLQWAGPNSSTSAITGYALQRATAAEGPWARIATYAANATNATDSGLGNNATTHYRIAALGEAGESLPSNVLTARTYGTPWHPLNFTATLEGSNARLRWEAPSDNGGTPISGYHIFRGASPTTMTLRAQLPATARDHTDSAVHTQEEEKTGRLYFRIAAVNAAGVGTLSQTRDIGLSPVAPPENNQQPPVERATSAGPYEPKWETSSAITASRGRAIATSADSSRVFTAGEARVGGSLELYVVAHDAITGAPLWNTTRGSAFSSDHAAAIAVDPSGQRIYVTGRINGDAATLALRASDGVLLWQRLYDADGLGDAGTALVLSRDGATVVVAATSAASASLADYAILAYRASDGASLWNARYATGADDEPVAIGIDPAGKRIFVTGTSGGDYATLAYNATTGAQEWLRRYHGGADDFAAGLAVAPDGSRVYVTGTSSGAKGLDYVTLAYAAATGAEAWTNRFDGLPLQSTRSDDVASGIAASADGSRVFVTGTSSGSPETGLDMHTIAYSASTGAPLWIQRTGSARGVDDQAFALAVAPDDLRVYVVGRAWNGTRGFDATITALDAATGLPVWSRTRGGAGMDAAYAVAVGADANVHMTGSRDEPSTARLFVASFGRAVNQESGGSGTTAAIRITIPNQPPLVTVSDDERVERLLAVFEGRTQSPKRWVS